MRDNNYWAKWTVVIGAVLACSLPWILTRSYWSFVDFNNTGPIGDTIGGIAGPVLNFAGLLVVYFSLREQLVANKLQRKQIRKEVRRSRNEKFFELTFQLVEKFLEAIVRNDNAFAELPRHDFARQFKLKATSDETPPLGVDAYTHAVWMFNELSSYFTLISDRLKRDELSFDQKLVLIRLVDNSYGTKLRGCRVTYQVHFPAANNNDALRSQLPDMLNQIDDEIGTLFLLEQEIEQGLKSEQMPISRAEQQSKSNIINRLKNLIKR